MSPFYSTVKREQVGVVVGIGSQHPRPFGFAQGRLCVCKERRHKDGAPSRVEIREDDVERKRRLGH
jgi:hypothetical protein